MTRQKRQGQSQPKIRVLFAARLKIARQHRYKYASKFASVLEIEHERYRTWERAEREPDITHLFKIADALDVSLDFLILGDIPSFRRGI